MFWSFRLGGSSVVLIPTSPLASPPALWGLAVGPVFASERDYDAGGFGLGDGEGVVGGQGSS